MTNQRLNSEEHRGFWLKGASKTQVTKIYKRFYLQGKLMCYQVMWVHSSACLYVLDRRWGARAHTTTQKTHNAVMEAMARATQEMQANVACAQSRLLGSSVLCQILPKLIDNNCYVLLVSAQDQSSSIMCKCEIIPTRIVILLRIN